MSWWDFKDLTKNLNNIKSHINQLVIEDDVSMDPDIEKQLETGKLKIGENCTSCQSFIDKLNKDTIEFKSKIKSLLDDRKVILESQEKEMHQLKNSVAYSIKNEFLDEVNQLRDRKREQTALINELNDKINAYVTTNKALSDQLRVRLDTSKNAEFLERDERKLRYEQALELLKSADKCLELCEKEALENNHEFTVSYLKELFLDIVKDPSFREYLESYKENDSLTQFIGDLVQFFESLISSISSKSEQDITLIKCLTNKEISELKDSLTAYKGTQKNLDTEINRLKLHLIDIEDTHNAELSELSESYNKVSSLQKKNEEAYKKEKEMIVNELLTCKDELLALKNERDTLNKQNGELESKLCTLSVSVDNQKKLNEELHNVLNSIKREYDDKYDFISKKIENDKKSLEMSLNEELLEEKTLNKQYREEIVALKNMLIHISKNDQKIEDLVFEKSPENIPTDNNKEELLTTLVLIKNIITAYRKSPAERKPQVYKVLCEILGLDTIENNMEQPHNNSLLGYIPILGRFISSPRDKMEVETVKIDDSLSHLLISYLEKEAAKGDSVSPISIHKLRKMINEIEGLPYSFENTSQSNDDKTRLAELL